MSQPKFRWAINEDRGSIYVYVEVMDEVLGDEYPEHTEEMAWDQLHDAGYEVDRLEFIEFEKYGLDPYQGIKSAYIFRECEAENCIPSWELDQFFESQGKKEAWNQWWADHHENWCEEGNPKRLICLETAAGDWRGDFRDEMHRQGLDLSDWKDRSKYGL